MHKLTLMLALILISASAFSAADEHTCKIVGATNAADFLQIHVSTVFVERVTLWTHTTELDGTITARPLLMFNPMLHNIGGFKGDGCMMTDNTFKPLTGETDLYYACIGTDFPGNVLFSLRVKADHSGSFEAQTSGATGVRTKRTLELVECL